MLGCCGDVVVRGSEFIALFCTLGKWLEKMSRRLRRVEGNAAVCMNLRKDVTQTTLNLQNFFLGEYYYYQKK